MPTIRELREAKGWSQQELASAAGLSITSISNLERNATQPNKATIKLVAMALGVKPEDVTGIVVLNRVSKSGSDGA